MRKEKMKRKGVEQTRERRKRIREEKMGNEKLEKNILGGGGGGGPTIRWRAKRKINKMKRKEEQKGA